MGVESHQLMDTARERFDFSSLCGQTRTCATCAAHCGIRVNSAVRSCATACVPRAVRVLANVVIGAVNSVSHSPSSTSSRRNVSM